MVEEVRLYVEGGGHEADGRAALRRGFNVFLREANEACRRRRVRWNLTMCGPRNEAHSTFLRALDLRGRICPILLVDAEDHVAGEGPWSHLGWDRGRASDEQCHLMVVMMESWFLADGEALARYYGKGFDAGSLPQRQEVERIAKSQIEDGLRRATRGTAKARYEKIRHGAELLERIDPAKVRGRAPWCDRLFTTIERLLSS